MLRHRHQIPIRRQQHVAANDAEGGDDRLAGLAHGDSQCAQTPIMHDNWPSKGMFPSDGEILDECGSAANLASIGTGETHLHRLPRLGACVVIRAGWLSGKKKRGAGWRPAGISELLWFQNCLGQEPGFWNSTWARRFFNSGTPGGVGTSRSVNATPTVVISASLRPLSMRNFFTVSARRCDSRKL
jgi:hypothetical protein